MAHKQMNLKGFLRIMKQAMDKANHRRFCFVLGAGASKESGIKTGQEMVNEWEKELIEMFGEDDLAKWKLNNSITNENKYSHYSQYYDYRFRETEDGYSYIEGIMNNAKPSAGYVILSYLLANTRHQVVITTNFDHLTEDAVNYYAQTIPQVIPHEALAHFIRREIYRPTIVKIHRDMLLNPKNRPTELDKLDEKWETALSNIFSVYSPIFIGYAGNDRSLMNFLHKNSDKFQVRGEWKTPYWMLYYEDKLEDDVLSFVDSADGYVIKHEGFDQTMCQIGAMLGYSMPTEDSFLQDPKKRYIALDAAIKKYFPKGEQSEGSGSKNTSENSTAVENAIQHITARKRYSDYLSMYMNKDYEKAFITIKELAEFEPDNIEYKNNLETMYHSLGRSMELLEYRQKLVDNNPDNVGYLMDLCKTLRVMGRYEQALKAEKKAVNITQNASYLDELSKMFLSLERYEEAFKASKKAVKLEPKNAWYWNKLGITLIKMERIQEAIKAFQKAVELAPEENDYLENLIDAQKRRTEFHE